MNFLGSEGYRDSIGRGSDCQSECSSPRTITSAPSITSRKIRKDPSSQAAKCGSDILHDTQILLRRNNRQCLRVRGERQYTSNNYKYVDLDADGQGFGDASEHCFIFGITDREVGDMTIQYDDIVVIRCANGPYDGYTLSLHDATQSIIAKQCSLVTVAQTWKIVHPYSRDINAKWHGRKRVMTGDKIMLRFLYNGNLLSCQTDADGRSKLVTLRDRDDRKGQVWEIGKRKLPYEPGWNREREYLTGWARIRKSRCESSRIPLSSFPASTQEQLMVEDLLYVFLGFKGQYLDLDVQEDPETDSMQKFRFDLDQRGVDPSVAALTLKCVNLGEYYLKLTFYVEKFSLYEHGQVHQALSAAIKSLLKEYLIVVAQLEHQARSINSNLSLQNMWCFVQPSMRTMQLLCKIADACAAIAGGGALLTAVQRVRSSVAEDSVASQVFAFIMQQASKPYLEMLQLWIYHGRINDPYGDFMICRNDNITKGGLLTDPCSKYWRDRYTLRKTETPSFLSRSAEKVLMTGKYLNVLRSCRRLASCPFARDIPYYASERMFDEMIDQAHQYASRALLDYFVRENDLMTRLHSLKHYFMMEQGDFFVDFMDVAEVELSSRIENISLSRLESLLQLSLQTSCSSDAYKDDVVCFLSPIHLISQMEHLHDKFNAEEVSAHPSSFTPLPGYKVIDAFTLDYKVQWPISLIISREALLKYQMIFRHVFFCKHVERRLCDAWLNHQTTKELSLRFTLGPSYCLRQKMLHFQKNYVYYMMVEVISQRFHTFRASLETVTSVDEIMKNHQSYLDICLKECLLTDPGLLRLLTKLMTVCMSFADSIERFTRPYFLDEDTIKAEREADRDRRAEKKAREEAEALLNTYQKYADKNAGLAKRATKLKRRQSSNIDMRRARIQELSNDVKRALTERDGNSENPFVRTTSDLERQFQSLLSQLMQQLLRRSVLQNNEHLADLCTRLDYNSFYTF